MPPHLNAMKARLGRLVDYHAPRLGIARDNVDARIVNRMPWPHHCCSGLATSTGRTVPAGYIELSRPSIEKHWVFPDWLDDGVVHELMHLTVNEGSRNGRRVVHGPVFRKKIVAYGYHPTVWGWNHSRRVLALE